MLDLVEASRGNTLVTLTSMMQSVNASASDSMDVYTRLFPSREKYSCGLTTAGGGGGSGGGGIGEQKVYTSWHGTSLVRYG